MINAETYCEYAVSQNLLTSLLSVSSVMI